jgi:ABC-type sulfate/molybdate transport systems ATPase subunit
MSALATTIITGSTLLKLVVGAVVAGLGVTIAFSLLIFCADRAAVLRRSDQRAMGRLFQAASVLALATVLAIVAYGLILTVSKPK